MQISLMLKALEVKGMVERPRSASDTRAKWIEITTVGISALRTAMPIVIAIRQRMFGDAGAPHGVLLSELHEIEARAERA